jgi:hypothetical protein
VGRAVGITGRAECSASFITDSQRRPQEGRTEARTMVLSDPTPLRRRHSPHNAAPRHQTVTHFGHFEGREDAVLDNTPPGEPKTYSDFRFPFSGIRQGQLVLLLLGLVRVPHHRCLYIQLYTESSTGVVAQTTIFASGALSFSSHESISHH